jgi:hypothetical protein
MRFAGFRLIQSEEQVKNTTLSSEIKTQILFLKKPPGRISVYFNLDRVILTDKL